MRTRPPSFLRLALFGLAALAALASPRIPLAHAEDPAAASTTPAPSTCTLKGTHPVAKGTQIFDAVKDGRVIAEMSGATGGLQLSEIPADPSAGRAKIATSNGSATLRIEGYIAPSAVTIYVAKDVPISGSHVAIADGQRVKLSKTSGNQITSELTIAGSNSQVVKGTAGCEHYALEKGAVTPYQLAGNARGYQMKSASLELFDDAGGSSILTLNMMEGTGQLFWSTESKSGYVHITMRGDIVVDAWAKASALSPLKKGEMMDQSVAAQTVIAGAKLALDSAPTLVKATKDIAVRARRDEKEKPIGTVESGAEVYIMETVAGWANVLPKSLALTPPADGGFWIAAADVPSK